MAFHLGLGQKRRCASLDGQRGNGNDKLVEATALVQLKHGPGVHISFSRSCFHLDVEKAVVGQGFYLIGKHIGGNVQLGGLVQQVGSLAHHLQGLAAELVFQQRILMARLWRLLYRGLHHRGHAFHGQKLVAKVILEF